MEHSDRDSWEFRLGDEEQVIVVQHLSRKKLDPTELQAVVIDLFQIRLNAIQTHSGNSCRFDSPILKQMENKFDIAVFAEDIRNKVLMSIGFFGLPKKILVVSYFNYSRSCAVPDFRKKANTLLSSVLRYPQPET